MTTTPISPEDLRLAGMLTAHIDVLSHMRDLRTLIKARREMKKAGAMVGMYRSGAATLISGTGSVDSTMDSGELDTTFSLLRGLKGHEAAEYAVTIAEIEALEHRALEELKQSEDMQALASTIGRIRHEPAGTTQAAPRTAETTREAQETPAEQPAAQHDEQIETAEIPWEPGDDHNDDHGDDHGDHHGGEMEQDGNAGDETLPADEGSADDDQQASADDEAEAGTEADAETDAEQPAEQPTRRRRSSK